jgi:anti-anti-sigma regulatory factor
MLRISRSDSGHSTSFLLEGKLLEPWLDELRDAIARVPSARAVVLDLSGLSFIDAPGAVMLATLKRSGTCLESPSPLVAALIAAAIG